MHPVPPPPNPSRPHCRPRSRRLPQPAPRRWLLQDARLPQQRVVEGVAFPAVLVPSAPASPAATGGVDEFLAVVRSEREARLEPLLRDARVLLLRGFTTWTAADFDHAVDAFRYEELPYVGSAAPRTNVVGRVFTTNKSPPDHKIPFHHELAQVRAGLEPLLAHAQSSSSGLQSLWSHYVYKRMQEKIPEFVEKLEKDGLIK